ncbi:hypothetical protein CTAM01_00773 [Colletotrichum tamarilloi]|uniref:Uncharacterized protein n=1 Tax=Colletotrichum tamarilloi TaxID=1209934 RepID=A0ABQ9RS51_9PEZI|nr:uncharacterized protein CTAM01_00773 [Colletotrichum tamarilloi]KAK1511843.1 hypothetical protein CTAM01_00773 [Colletotrichum tamarilloi]
MPTLPVCVTADKAEGSTHFRISREPAVVRRLGRYEKQLANRRTQTSLHITQAGTQGTRDMASGIIFALPFLPTRAISGSSLVERLGRGRDVK